MEVQKTEEIDESVLSFTPLSEHEGQLDRMNFTWEATDFTAEKLLIQLTFEHPLEIS